MNTRQKIAIALFLVFIGICVACYIIFGNKLLKIVSEPVVFREWLDKFGRYDELVRKMGRSCSAIGFAVSLDKLSELSRNERAASIDVMLVYGEKTPFSVVYKTCEALRQQGMTVIALSRLDTSIRATKTLYLKADGTVSERTEDN